MSDGAEVGFMPGLMAHLANRRAPLHERVFNGEVNIAIGYFTDLEKDAYYRQSLFGHMPAQPWLHCRRVSSPSRTRRLRQHLGSAIGRRAAPGDDLVGADQGKRRFLQRAQLRIRQANHVQIDLPLRRRVFKRASRRASRPSASSVHSRLKRSNNAAYGGKGDLEP
jgi:hypothetical protein